MLARVGLPKEGVEGVIGLTDGVVIRHHAVGLDAVLKAVELPTGITHLDPGLADVDGNTLSHLRFVFSTLQFVSKRLFSPQTSMNPDQELAGGNSISCHGSY